MYTIYMTQPGDTLSEMAYRYYGSTNLAYINRLTNANPLLKLIGGSNVLGCVLEPFQAIALPANVVSSFLHQHQFMVDAINSMPRQHRKMLTEIQTSEVDPNHILAATEAGYIPHHKEGQKPEERKEKAEANEKPHNLVQEAAIEVADKLFEVSEKRADNLEKAVKAMDAHIRNYKRLAKFRRQAYFNRYIKPAYEDMHQAYHRRVTVNYAKRFCVPEIEKVPSVIQKRGFAFSGFEDVEAVVRLIPRWKMLGRGCFAVSAIMSGIEVYDTYEEHGDWHKELAKQIAGLALGFAVGAIAVTLLASFGWVVVVVGAAAASMAGSNAGERFGGWLWDRLSSLSNEDFSKYFQNSLSTPSAIHPGIWFSYT